MYEIDRKTASRMLKMSVRTIDRYIAKNKISSERRDGRIWLDKKEIQKLRDRQKVDMDNMSTLDMSIDKAEIMTPGMSIDTTPRAYQQTRERPAESEERVYKKLFEELQHELKEKHERLEGANYHVGQLEARLKDSIPLLDYNRDLSLERSEKERLRKNVDAQQFELEQISNTLKEERFNKKVYLIILFILLLLQPLWFFFPIK